MIVCDTSFLYALLDRGEPMHGEAVAWYLALDDAQPLVTTPLILAELDYFANGLGPVARNAWLGELARGYLGVEWWLDAPGEACAVAERYTDQRVSLADASLVALAARHGVDRVATFDHHHFRVMTPLTGHRAFRLLPADA